MAGGFVPFGQNLQLQSGVPLAKVGSAFFEKLSIVKRLDGGQMGSLMQKVLSDGNLSSVMQNPMAGLTQGIQGQMPGLTSQLGGMGGGGASGLIAALTGSGGLSQAMGLLQGSGDNLAGLTNGATGFFAMIGHGNTQDMAGSAMPAQYGIDVVTGPLAAYGFLSTVAMNLPRIVAQVLAGTMTVSAAIAWVQAQITTALNLVSASAAALAWSEANHPLIATVASVAGALAIPPVFDASGRRQNGTASGFQALLASLVRAEAALVMAAALAAQITHTTHDPIDVAGLTSLEG